MAASHILDLQCVLCQTRYAPGAVAYTCPKCGPLGVLSVHYDYDRVRWNFSRESRDTSIRRYRAFLPISYSHRLVMPLHIGGTPLYPVQRLREHLGMRHLWLKDETRNPSASLKDRASFVAVTLAGERTVACASTGNAASSLAVQAAAAGLPCYIFVPENAPRAKVVQLLMCGATVFAVRGSYDEAFDLCIAACERFGWYNRNTGYNPYLVEGKKTAGLEIVEQLGDGVPDTVLVPTGDGCIISGIYRGFEDMRAIGITHTMPRLIAVQSEEAPALVRALEGDGELRPYPAQTIADGISVSLPRNGAMALQHIRKSGGFGVTVSDEQILAAQKELARLTGVFAEPSGAVCYAGLLRLLEEGRIARNERVVLLVTGSGLKSIDAVAEQAGSVVPIAADESGLEAVERVVQAPDTPPSEPFAEEE